MGFEHNELSGTLFNNDRKTNDRQPDMTGSCKIDNVDYWISGWIKEGTKGEFISMAFTTKDVQSHSDNLNNSGSKTGSFPIKKRQGNSARNEHQQQQKSKFEKDKEEFEAMTTLRPDTIADDEFDDEIPF